MMTDSELLENLTSCQLLLSAIATEPEIFMEIVGENDFNERFVSGYFAGLLDISRGTS